MPTYEYVCHDCSNRFEKWQKMSETPLTTCPTCGGPIRRVFYPAGIVFKGSGFYKTDHTGNASANGHTHTEETSAGKEAAAATAASTSTASSAESKAATDSKTESKAS